MLWIPAELVCSCRSCPIQITTTENYSHSTAFLFHSKSMLTVLCLVVFLAVPIDSVKRTQPIDIASSLWIGTRLTSHLPAWNHETHACNVDKAFLFSPEYVKILIATLLFYSIILLVSTCEINLTLENDFYKLTTIKLLCSNHYCRYSQAIEDMQLQRN